MYFNQVKISNKVFALFKKQMHKSLYADLEKSIERLKKCLQNFICDTQLNQVRYYLKLYLFQKV